MFALPEAPRIRIVEDAARDQLLAGVCADERRLHAISRLAHEARVADRVV
jgi:hypothetical protein